MRFVDPPIVAAEVEELDLATATTAPCYARAEVDALLGRCAEALLLHERASGDAAPATAAELAAVELPEAPSGYEVAAVDEALSRIRAALSAYEGR